MEASGLVSYIINVSVRRGKAYFAPFILPYSIFAHVSVPLAIPVTLPYKHQKPILCIENGSAKWIRYTTSGEWVTGENGALTILTEDASHWWTSGCEVAELEAMVSVNRSAFGPYNYECDEQNKARMARDRRLDHST